MDDWFVRFVELVKFRELTATDALDIILLSVLIYYITSGHYEIWGVPTGGGVNVEAIGPDGEVIAKNAAIYNGYEGELYINLTPVPVLIKPD